MMRKIDEMEMRLNRTMERLEQLAEEFEEHRDANNQNVDTYDRKIDEFTEMIRAICPHEDKELTTKSVLLPNGSKCIRRMGHYTATRPFTKCTVCGLVTQITQDDADELRVERLKKELKDAQERVKKNEEGK